MCHHSGGKVRGLKFGAGYHPEFPGEEAVRRESSRRTLATGLALPPLVVSDQKPGHEIEYPLAVVIFSGLVTSTELNLFLLSPLSLRFGRHTAADREGQK